MDTQKYIDGLFADYEASPDLADFKEELRSNLEDRIANLVKKGLPQAQAFAKATAELGDISSLATEISLTKKKELLSEMYMNTRNYMSLKQKIAYTVAGGFLALGIVICLLAYFATGNIVAGLGSLVIFFIIPVCAFVFLGLTQETASKYPMPKKRALLYTAAALLILFGLVVFALTFFAVQNTDRALASLGTLIPFVIPGGAALAFLLLTEKSRHKPWVVEQQAAWVERMHEQFADPYASTRFGLFSGALWIFALALFVTLGFLIGFRYSWLIFLFAIAAQILLQALLLSKQKQ